MDLTQDQMKQLAWHVKEMYKRFRPRNQLEADCIFLGLGEEKEPWNVWLEEVVNKDILLPSFEDIPGEVIELLLDILCPEV